jgi:hypothetical protein
MLDRVRRPELLAGQSFLAKPFSVSSLAHGVRSVLDGAGAIASD